MKQSIETLAIHAGYESDPVTGAILAPIHQSTTYVQSGLGEHRGYTYSRADNPTVYALERALGGLEDALPALCFSSGMSAITTLFLAALKSGDHVVCGDAVYGGTVRLLREFLGELGVEVSFVDMADIGEIERSIKSNTKLVFIESPANPTLKLTDIEAACSIAKRAGALSVLDNTFLTAVLQRPLDLGADASLYSTTKYIEGHDATLGGAIVVRDEALRNRLHYARKATGTIQEPWEAWLTIRGLKTLPMRMREHSANAYKVARWLESQDVVKSVAHPFLDSFAQRELAGRQQLDGGGIVSFELRGGIESARCFLPALKLCSLAENLGAAETLITHPATMTHSDVPLEQREACGITDGLIRLSVGLEGANDIIADLKQALKALELTHAR